MALIMGTGFPPFRGGLLRFADEMGIPDVVGELMRLSTAVDERFAPCDYLKLMVLNHQSFYNKENGNA